MLKKQAADRNHVINMIKEYGSTFQIRALITFSLNEFSLLISDCLLIISNPPSHLKPKELKELRKVAKQRISTAITIAETVRTQSK